MATTLRASAADKPSSGGVRLILPLPVAIPVYPQPHNLVWFVSGDVKIIVVAGRSTAKPADTHVARIVYRQGMTAMEIAEEIASVFCAAEVERPGRRVMLTSNKRSVLYYGLLYYLTSAMVDFYKTGETKTRRAFPTEEDAAQKN